MNKKILTYTALLILICSAKLQADHYFQKIHKYTTEHGLVNNTISSIFQDLNGRLWVGSPEGLSLYNGKQFINFKFSDSLADNTIFFIDQIDNHQLLLGCKGGNYIFSIHKKSFIKIHLPENENSPATALFRIKGEIFIGSRKGIYRYNFQKQTGERVHKSATSCKQISTQNKILVGSYENGVGEANWVKGKLLIKPIFPSLRNKPIKSIHIKRDGTILILCQDGLWAGNKHLFQKIIVGKFSSLETSQEDEILLGSYGYFIQQVYLNMGKYALKPYIKQDNELFNDYFDSQVNVLYKSYSGVIWIGTYQAGLNRIDRKKIAFRKYKSKNRLNKPESGYINVLTQTKDGVIWAGTSGMGLYRLDKTNEELLAVKILNLKSDHLFIEALLHHHNTLYIGTRYQGILTANYPTDSLKLIKLSGRLYATKVGLKQNAYIYQLKIIDKQLCITTSDGNFKYNFETKNIIRTDKLPTINLETDSLHNKWLITENMTVLLNQIKLKINPEVSDILLTKNQCAWLTTSKGLAFFNRQDETIKFFNPPGKVIEFTSIREDSQEQLWLGSRMEIFRFNPRSKIFSTYHIPGGSKSNSFNYGKILKTSEGEFFWGSNDRIISIKPDTSHYIPYPKYEVIKDSIKKPGQFQVFIYSYNHQEENSIIYRISHPDSLWHTIPGTFARLNFSEFKTGNYTLDINAINSDGQLNANYQSFYFKIKNPLKNNLYWFIIIISNLIGLYLYKQQRYFSLSFNKNYKKTTSVNRIYKQWMSNDFMRKTIDIIEKNLSNCSFEINDLNKDMQMSQSNFYRKLKTKTNLSPLKIIRFIRIRKSADLLIKTELSINEIAYEVGYSSPAYFSRHFKLQFGIVPSEYREKYSTMKN